MIAEGEYYGMQTFDQALLRHYQAGRVSMEDALRVASSPHDFKLLVAADGRTATSMDDLSPRHDAATRVEPRSRRPRPPMPRPAHPAAERPSARHAAGRRAPRTHPAQPDAAGLRRRSLSALHQLKHCARIGIRMASKDTCPVCRTAEIVCGKWTLLVIRDLAEGRSRFCELERSLRGHQPRTLSLRLRALEEEGDRRAPDVPRGPAAGRVRAAPTRAARSCR